MIALLLGVALAAESAMDVNPVLSVGYEAVTNDPFVYRRGLRLAGGVDLGRWLGIELSGGAYPDLGRGDYSAFTKRLVDELRVIPDLSRIIATGRVGALVWPVVSGEGSSWARLGLGGGAALFYTWDDLDAMGRDEVTATDRELHPAAYGEVRAEAWHRAVGLRVRLEASFYREVILETSYLDKRPTWVGVEVGWRPGSQP